MLWWDSQSLSVSINEGLEEWFVMGDGLQDVPISCHVADSPLAQPSAAQPEDVAERETTILNQQHNQCNLLFFFESVGKCILGMCHSKSPSVSHLPGLWMNLCRRALTSS